MKLFILLLTLICPCILHAQFIPAQRLSESDSISYLPYNNSNAISVIGQIVHIVYTDRRDGAGEVFYKRSLDGGSTWDTDRRLTADDNIFSGRATIVAWNNQVHIVWMDRRDGNNELYYKRSTNNGNTWSDDERLTTDGGISEYPSLALEFQTLHLVWNDDRHGNNEIYYKRSINGGLSWTADTRITNNAGDSFKPSVAVSDTLVHVLWEDLRNGTSEIFYKTSRNSGNTWSNDMKLSNSASDCYAPCVSANGTIAFATWDDNRTPNSQVYGRRTIDGGNAWTPEINHSNSAGEAYSAFHSFSGTYLNMVYTLSFNDDPDIYGRFSTDAGASWGGFGVTTNFSSSENAFVAISGAAVHLIWQDDQDDNLEIYYTRMPTANPFDHQHTSAWANHISSGQTDVSYAMTSDRYSNVYVTGSFSGTVDFDPGPGEMFLTSSGSTDAFVYKLDPFGNFIWAKKIGGPETDIAYDIVLDGNGNIVITGSFHTIVDFDPGLSVVNIGSLGQEDIFVLKLDHNGNYRWAKRMGGGGRDESGSIDINTSNDIIIAGYFAETADFDPGPNNTDLSSNGEEDIFITSLNSSGEYLWARSIGGTGFDGARDLAVDADNNIVVTGYFRNSADFDPGNGEHILTSLGGSDIFISKLNQSGELDWAHRFGYIEEDEGNGITTDQDGEIYATGYFSDKVDFNPDGFVYLLEAESEGDIYTLRLHPDGGFSWAQRAGGSGFDEGSAIAYRDDAVYVTGMFESIGEFHPGLPEVELRSSGNSDIFLQKLNATNGHHLWINQFGGTMRDVALDVHPVPYGKVGVTGYFEGTADFSPNIDQQTFISAGEEDGFVTLVSECVPSYAELELIVCDGYPCPYPDSIITQSGIYTLILESSSGCDSVVTLMLTVLEKPETIVTETACDSYTTPDGSQTWTESGIYTEVLMSVDGCDSIVTYNLTILSSSAQTEVVHACDMYITPEGEILTESGVYVYQHTNAAGCDSVFTIELTLGTTTFGERSVDACESFTSPNGDTWYESGMYTYTIPNASGCDSVITLDLGIINFEASIMLFESTLIAGPTGSFYQWLDCDQQFAAIEGETDMTFTPTISGTYAVQVNPGVGCVDTTTCITVMVVSAEDADMYSEITIYPNPVHEQLFIDLPGNIGFTELILTDLQGKRVMTSSVAGNNHLALDLTMPAGMYFLTVIMGDERRSFKVVKM